MNKYKVISQLLLAIRSNWASILIFLIIEYILMEYNYINSKENIIFIGLFFILLITISILNLKKLVNYSSYILVIVFISVELALVQFYPQLWPKNLVGYMEPNKQKEFAKANGLQVDMLGENLLYYYRPNQKIGAYPEFKVDKNGYRNKEEWSNNPDIVMLGDSITIAAGSKVDAADLFRNEGFKVINLSMGGYAPQQYRDALSYKIIKNNIKPKFVIVVLFVGNDFRDSTLYNQYKIEGKDYKAYFGEPKLQIEYRKNIFEIERLFLAWKSHNDWLKREEPYLREVNLPYKNFRIGYAWSPPDIEVEKASYMLVENTLLEINKLSNNVGAKTILMVMPSPGVIYSNFSEKFNDEAINYKKILKRLELQSKNSKIEIIDGMPNLTYALKNNFIFLNNSDTHLNEFGVDAMFIAMKNKVYELSK